MKRFFLSWRLILCVTLELHICLLPVWWRLGYLSRSFSIFLIMLHWNVYQPRSHHRQVSFSHHNLHDLAWDDPEIYLSHLLMMILERFFYCISRRTLDWQNYSDATRNRKTNTNKTFSVELKDEWINVDEEFFKVDGLQRRDKLSMWIFPEENHNEFHWLLEQRRPKTQKWLFSTSMQLNKVATLDSFLNIIDFLQVKCPPCMKHEAVW